MQRFDPTAENRRVTGEIFNGRYGYTELLNKRLRTARGVDFYVLLVQEPDNWFETVFIKNGDQG